jgi:hypothetical protein
VKNKAVIVQGRPVGAAIAAGEAEILGLEHEVVQGFA